MAVRCVNTSGTLLSPHAAFSDAAVPSCCLQGLCVCYIKCELNFICVYLSEQNLAEVPQESFTCVQIETAQVQTALRNTESEAGYKSILLSNTKKTNFCSSLHYVHLITLFGDRFHKSQPVFFVCVCKNVLCLQTH